MEGTLDKYLWGTIEEIFYSMEKLYIQDIPCFVSLHHNSQICDVLMTISIWETVRFLTYYLYHSWLGQLINIAMGNIISNLSEMLGPLWTSSKSFPILQTTAMSQLSMISMKYDKFFIFSK